MHTHVLHAQRLCASQLSAFTPRVPDPARAFPLRRSGTFYLPWSCASGAAVCVGGTGLLCEGGLLGCSSRQRYSTCFSADEVGDLYGPSVLHPTNCSGSACTGGTLGARAAAARAPACLHLTHAVTR
jgi:hypothetical protein